MSVPTIRTTITLPIDLVDAADRAVREGKARSRNDLLVAALRHELAAQERAEIDAAFAALADDEEFHAESIAFAEEAVRAGWEALHIAEADERDVAMSTTPALIQLRAPSRRAFARSSSSAVTRSTPT